MYHQIVIALALAAFVVADRLDRLYLPSSYNQADSVAGAYSSQNHNNGPAIPILSLDNSNDGSGNYNYHYETGNGIYVQESGHQKGADSQEAKGSFAYTSPEGQSIQITYVADENGFRAEGAHLPTPPPIPEAILKSIEYNLAEEARGGYKDNERQYDNRNFGIENHNQQQYLPPHASAQGGYKY